MTVLPFHFPEGGQWELWWLKKFKPHMNGQVQIVVRRRMTDYGEQFYTSRAEPDLDCFVATLKSLNMMRFGEHAEAFITLFGDFDLRSPSTRKLMVYLTPAQALCRQKYDDNREPAA